MTDYLLHQRTTSLQIMLTIRKIITFCQIMNYLNQSENMKNHILTDTETSTTQNTHLQINKKMRKLAKLLI